MLAQERIQASKMPDVSPQPGRHRDRDSRRRSRSRDRYRSRSRSRSRSRDGDRGRRRSFSPSERRHRSRSKSNEQYDQEKKRRRPTWFDIQPLGGVPVPISQLPGAVMVTPDGAGVAPLGGGIFAGGNQQATRHARRIYVGGLPIDVREETISSFFSNALAAVGGTTAGPGSCVVSVYINHEKKFAFVEMRTVEEASNAMALDGIMFEGGPVRIRRPADYKPAAAAALGPSAPNPNLNLAAIGLDKSREQHKVGYGAGQDGLQAAVPPPPSGSDRIFVGGLPYFLTDQQCRELLGSFGAIKQFDLVIDRATGRSKGYGFVTYEDPAAGPIAIEGLNGMKLQERTLTVRVAEGPHKSVGQAVQGQPTSAPGPPSVPSAPRVLKLVEAITVDELKDDEEYEDIMEDMREELMKYGELKQLHIPRPVLEGQNPPGVGKVIAEFAEPGQALAARNALHGKKFGGRVVQATLMTEEDYNSKRWD